MSRTSAKHRKSARATSARAGAHAKPRPPSPLASAVQLNPTRTAVTVTGAVLIAAAATPALVQLPGHASQPPGPGPSTEGGQAAAFGRSGSDPGLAGPQPSSARSAQHPSATSTLASRRSAAPKPTAPARPRHHHRHPPAVYRDPLRGLAGLVAERIDQGVDFAGSGPIYAIGDGVVTNATGTSGGWPGGGWITYRLTNGPAAGLTVYVAEDVRPTVSVGQTVTPDTVIADMFAGAEGIETGWAMANGLTAESQLPEAGGISGAGPFPTSVGVNFDQLLQALGVPPSSNSQDPPYGLLPAQYPSDWSAVLNGGG